MKDKKTAYQIIKSCGGMVALARECGIGRKTLYAAIAAQSVNPAHCPIIERYTNGAVRCEWLNPAVDWAYIRSSGRVTAEQASVAAVG